ncbi:MAG TPA: hypothetical protein VFM44_00710 [Gemmatimonadota bacterium]|nr:hypothetical protein [Gemmatimonadota bacterium]
MAASRKRTNALALALAVACGGSDPGPRAAGPEEAAAPEEVERQAAADEVPDPRSPARRIVAWAGDVDRADSDFLAVLDADPESPRYGSVIASVPVGGRGTHPHHTEHRMPSGGTLFANGFMAGATFRFDLTDPEAPRLLGSFEERAGFTFPHSYERLENGNVLATFQGQGPDNVDPGGLVEIDDSGTAVRSGSAADPAAPRALIRPYSLAIVPDLDRVVVTSYDMGEDMGMTGGRRGRTHVVQLWRLSDLSVIATIDLTPLPGGGGDEQPGEPRLLDDGRTVLVSTFTCGLYRITGLASGYPGAEPVHGFGGGGCAVPVVVGRFWVQSVPSANAIVALDVSDPGAPVEVSRLELGARSFPHWLALDEGSGRIVVADRGDGEERLYVARIDRATGELSLDDRFRDPGSGRPGVSFERSEWPHGATGAARPHGTVFVGGE